jgi:hypothetical protein
MRSRPYMISALPGAVLGACRAFAKGKSLDRSPSCPVTFEGSAAAPLELPTRKPWQGQDSEHVLEILCSLVPALVAAGEREGSGCAPLAQDPSRRRPVELLPKAKPDRLLDENRG